MDSCASTNHGETLFPPGEGPTFQLVSNEGLSGPFFDAEVIDLSWLKEIKEFNTPSQFVKNPTGFERLQKQVVRQLIRLVEDVDEEDPLLEDIRYIRAQNSVDNLNHDDLVGAYDELEIRKPGIWTLSERIQSEHLVHPDRITTLTRLLIFYGRQLP